MKKQNRMENGAIGLTAAISLSNRVTKRETPRSEVYSPAQEVSLAEAKLEAVLPRGSGHGPACVTLKTVSLHSVDAPCPLAGFHRQTALLRVDREHGELGLRQRA